MPRPLPRALLAVPALAALAAGAAGSERHFAYTYESAVLPAGQSEIELWATNRRGRDAGYYSAMDMRAEYEVGVTDRLQTAFYLNFRQETVEGPTAYETTSEVRGVSWEWKYKIADAVADPVGLAAYAELGVESDELELELKAIADKRIGAHLVAGNLTYEPEVVWEKEDGAKETEVEQQFEATLAYAYFIRPGLALGIEARDHNEFAHGEWEFSALFIGPTVFANLGPAAWATLSVLPQVAALKGETSDGLVLDDHERVEVRLLVGMHF